MNPELIFHLEGGELLRIVAWDELSLNQNIARYWRPKILNDLE